MENLKITLILNSSLIPTKRPLDGLLAKLWFEELKKEGKFDGDYTKKLPFLEYDEEGFYHISIPLYKTTGIENRTIFKSFDPKLYTKLFPNAKVTAKLFEIGKGRFKLASSSFELHHIPQIVFYAKGDRDKIVELLRNLKFFGKKSAYGYGKIERIEIETIDEDRSIVYQGRLMRHIPIESRYAEMIEKKRAALLPLTHPYWDRGRERYCYIPTEFDYALQ